MTDLQQPHVVHAEPSPDPHDERRGTLLDTTYDAAFVREVKDRWRHLSERQWDGDSETWWVVEGNEQACEQLVMEHFGGCLVVDEDGSETLRDPSGDYEQGGFF